MKKKYIYGMLLIVHQFYAADCTHQAKRKRTMHYVPSSAATGDELYGQHEKIAEHKQPDNTQLPACEWPEEYLPGAPAVSFDDVPLPMPLNIEPQVLATAIDTCKACNKAFLSLAGFTNHVMQDHTYKGDGKKKFTCAYNDCSKMFAQSAHLLRHVRTHTGEKPFVCNYEGCNKTFAQKSYLKTHERTHTCEKPYVCDQCTAAFAQSCQLKRHQAQHQAQKKFSCSHPGCNKAFSRSDTLQEHERIHTGEKPYLCTLCNTRFTQSSTLKCHLKIHHQKRSYVCSHSGCKKRFYQKYALSQHEVTH